MRKTLAVILFFYLAVAAWAQEANPGRPTVSTPATLTPVGYLQFETGVLGAEHSPDLPNQTSFNEVMKFSVNQRVELLLQTQPFAHSDLGPFQSNDPGDVSVGPQVVLLPGTKNGPLFLPATSGESLAAPLLISISAPIASLQSSGFN